MKTLLLVALLFCTVTAVFKADPVTIKTSQLFRKIARNSAGKDAILSIQAQLAVMEDSDPNLVDKVLKMLKSLREESTKALDELNEAINRAEQEDEEKSTSLEQKILQLHKNIAGRKELQASYQAQNDQLSQNLVDASKSAETFQSTLDQLEAKNEAKLKEFEQKVKEHDDIIEALTKARELIMQLSNNKPSFLQVNEQQVLAEVTKHISGVKSNLLELTLKLAGTELHADQEKVAAVIEIIDDLLEFEANTKSMEFQLENKRKLLYESKKASIIANEQRISGQEKEALADEKTNSIRIKEAGSDIAGWTERVGELEKEKEDLKAYFSERIKSLNERKTTLNELQELLEKVIAIFESDVLQNKDVKKVAGAGL